jgi:serine/threonine protein phosphatase PrpC
MRIGQSVVGTHTGSSKAVNEDAVLELPQVPLVAVVDGTGGPHASARVVETLRGEASALHQALLQLSATPSKVHRRAFTAQVERVFGLASEAVRRASDRGAPETAAASLVTALFGGTTAHVAHVGAARAYLFRDGALQCLTEDHTLTELKLRRGRISRAQARNHPERRVLYQALGGDLPPDVDITSVEVQPGDVIVLCSDGLTAALDDDTIARLIDPDDLHGSFRNCFSACLTGDGVGDDVSIALTRMDAEPHDVATDVTDAPTVPGILRPRVLRGEAPGVALARLSDEARRVVCGFLRERTWMPGEVMVAHGQEPAATWFLIEGTVDVSRTAEALASMTADRLGTIGWGTAYASPLTFTTATVCGTLELSPEAGARLRQAYPAVAAELASLLSAEALGLVDTVARAGLGLSSR